jgi:hypothetical protein
MNDIRLILGCATAPKRITELCSILDVQRERLKSMTPSIVSKRAWNARDADGWINHSVVDGSTQNDTALTIRQGDLVVVLNATDVAASYDPDVFDGTDHAPFPARPNRPDQVLARMDETIGLFRGLLAERSSPRSMRSGDARGMAILQKAERRMRAIGSAVADADVDAAAGIQIQAPCPWRGLEAVGLVGDGWRRLLDTAKRDTLWSDLPALVRIEVQPADAAEARAMLRRPTQSWRVNLFPTELDWRPNPGQSVIDRMREIGELPSAA